MSSTDRTAVLDDLQARGLVADVTDSDALRADLAAGPLTLYCGLDPTAPSLHMGNLVQLLTLRRFQLGGHRPIGLVGGATGLIGDPKDSGERSMNPRDQVAGWTDRVRGQVERFIDFDGPEPVRPLIVNNFDWTEPLSTLDFLRDIGKHFPVNRMLGREVVRTRLEAGISYTEFSYVLLQAMDYLELFRRYGCRLQFGGSDQWGNITAGVELIRRADGGAAHALATPLVTKADGTKYGKTETGTVWLDAELTSPYAFHQFWLSIPDVDVVSMLRIFTFLDLARIDELATEVEERPQARTAQRTLADEVTALVHGRGQAEAAAQAGRALFGRDDLAALDGDTLRSALREAPHVDLAAGEQVGTVTDLFVAAGLVASRSEARRAVSEGGAYLNNAKVSDPEYVPEATDWLAGGCLVLRRGKRTVGGVLKG